MSSASHIGARGPRLMDIGELSDALGMSLFYVPSMRNGAGAEPATDRGNAILSTLPILEPVAVELPFERQRRVAIFGQVPLSANERLNLGVVHLDALGSSHRLWLFGTPRMREVEARAVGSALPAGNLVVGSDLNTWRSPSEPAVRYLSGLFDAPSEDHGSHRMELRRLDRMFFRAAGGLRPHYETVPNAYGSDHHPIVGWLE
jgi:endonuclease/exonuclease/phosphatase family metal-dependent hydrolase